MKHYYTIFLGSNLWQNIIDDMNSEKIWGEGGMLWTSKKKAQACIKNLRKCDYETKKDKFIIRQFYY